MNTLFVPAPRATHGHRGVAQPRRTQSSSRRSSGQSTTLHRLLAAVDAHLLALLVDAPQADAGGSEIRLCLTVLLRLRRALAAQWTLLGEDGVVAEGLGDYLETVPDLLADLSSAGAPRLRRALDHCRELLSELAAMADPEAPVADLRARLQVLRQAPASPESTFLATADLAAALAAALDRVAPVQDEVPLAALLRQ